MIHEATMAKRQQWLYLDGVCPCSDKTWFSVWLKTFTEVKVEQRKLRSLWGIWIIRFCWIYSRVLSTRVVKEHGNILREKWRRRSRSLLQLLCDFECDRARRPCGKSRVRALVDKRGLMAFSISSWGRPVALSLPSFLSQQWFCQNTAIRMPQGPTQCLISPLFIFQNKRGKVSLEIRNEAD